MLRERDPASTRLTDADVVEIHKAHIAGKSWDEIAHRFQTNRKVVSRIVNADRWARLHPNKAPWLYEDEVDERTYTEAEIAAAARVGHRAFIDALHNG